jgi:phosphoserine phosphatase RsbU/P
MSHEDIPILVVDDAKFSSAVIAKALRSGGFTNVRFTNNPLQALRSIEKRPADILIADWLMPTMDGLELARRVKQLDDKTDHFTYVMLLTARDDIVAMQQALEQGVDDFLTKANLRGQLLPRVFAAQRIAERQNGLIRTNRALRRKIRTMATSDVVDPVTGLGNMRFTLDRIGDLMRDVEARGGAACLLLVGINNCDLIEQQYDATVLNEVMSGFGTRLRELVRPLDMVTRPERNIFAVAMRHPTIDNCTSTSFRRVFDELYMHAFKTSSGFIPVVVGVSLCAADPGTGLPDAASFLRMGREALSSSYDTGLIAVHRCEAVRQPSTMDG